MITAFSGKKNAKRAALIHLLFNIIGTIIMYVILIFGMEWVVDLLTRVSGENLGRQVANAHTIFKLFQVAVLFPFSGFLVKMTYLFVPGEDKEIGYRAKLQLEYIGGKNIFSPATAVFEATKELERMALLASENLNRAMNALITLDEEDIEEVYKVEDNINFLNHAITDYLVKINQTTLPIEDLKSIGGLFHVVNDIERIGDHAENVADAAKQRIESGVSISKDAQKELGIMLDKVNEMFRLSVEVFTNGKEENLDTINKLEDQVDDLERQYQANHVARLTKNECTPEAGMIFSDIVSGLERVADHSVNIAYSMIAPEEKV